MAARADLQVPERPQLAPGVRLAGQMEDSAFEDPPWLLEREGEGYVQVTELLYRIAERCDGRRDLSQIAAEVSDETSRAVSVDNVRQLLRQQFLVKGLIQTTDGRVAASSRGDRSLLAINMRIKIAGSGFFSPVVSLLRVLFWPPLLLLALVAVLAFQGWLYAVHGIAGGVREALYRPALLLVMLGATIVIAWFHELGHAAALRYGGGRVRAMGFGLYLVYPAFYTDVSDNYRLSRWARVRTDLGGFYFNLLASLSLGGLYAVTGEEFLLLIVTVVNLDIIRQLLPFVRLDGYWLLADLTGIPDFFSYMGRFLRNLLPLKRSEEDALPALKWWGSAVFLGYTLITIPLLLLLVFLVVTGLPRLLATAWDSFGKLGGAVSGAWVGGDAAGVAAAVAQMALLALPILGIVYSLFRVGRRSAGAAWTWSERSGARRAVVVAGGVGVLAALAYLWTPRLPAGRNDAGASGPAGDWRPIGSEERGRIVDAPRPVALVDLPRAPAPGDATTPALPSATPTASVTPTPEAASPSPAASPRASARPSPDPSARPSGGVALRTTVAASLRAGPGVGFAVIGTLRSGESMSATGRSADGAWYQVRSATMAGWLPAGQAQLEAGAIASLPIIAAPAVPSATPVVTSSPRQVSPSPRESPSGAPDR